MAMTLTDEGTVLVMLAMPSFLWAGAEIAGLTVGFPPRYREGAWDVAAAAAADRIGGTVAEIRVSTRDGVLVEVADANVETVAALGG